MARLTNSMLKTVVAALYSKIIKERKEENERRRVTVDITEYSNDSFVKDVVELERIEKKIATLTNKSNEIKKRYKKVHDEPLIINDVEVCPKHYWEFKPTKNTLNSYLIKKYNIPEQEQLPLPTINEIEMKVLINRNAEIQEIIDAITEAYSNGQE